jgi:sucrose-6-phosphatase
VKPFLLVTDLDHTLVGDDAALAELNAQLEWHRWEYGTRIVYATGRSLVSYQALTATTSLLVPDVLIAAVGTEVYTGADLKRTASPAATRPPAKPEPDWAETLPPAKPDPEWSDRLAPRWDRELIVATAEQFPTLVPQTASEQRPFKVSYHLPPQRATEVLSQLRSALWNCGLDIQLIYSGGKDLDILPMQADKGKAMGYVRDRLMIPSDRTIACGDSGNDIALFADRPEYGIIVGNARPELLHWHHSTPATNRYLAKAHCAAGMLEGLQFFGFL